MKILIIGSGGREHALAWKAAQSPRVSKVYVAPGNAGTALEKDIENVPISVNDISGLLSYAQQNTIDLTIVGPEQPLVDGIVDRFNQAGIACFGPTANAAQLEGSKSFCKEFMIRHRIPTADFATFSDAGEARAYIESKGAPIVVKADGLAAGKGVIVAQTVAEAIAAVDDMLAGNKFGQAGHRVVIEEFLRGEEASFIVIADGEHVLPMATSQDHKARDNGDTGPNTGGMGAYSPAPIVDQRMHNKVMDEIIYPTLLGMQRDGCDYRGFLYAGLMIGEDGRVSVLEFNCRLGDPETQPILMRLQSDIVELCLAAVNGELRDKVLQWDERPALGVVMAAGGYPQAYEKGDIIRGLPLSASLELKVFHAGTRQHEQQIITDGGRVLCACALGEDIAAAQRNAYSLVHQIDWPNVYFRSDIGFKAIQARSGETSN